MKELLTDIVVIGGGLAGTRAATAAAESGSSVLVVNKRAQCASTEIMGFNDPVSKSDSYKLYLSDILKSGGYINNMELANLLAQGGAKEREELIRRGLQFDKTPSGDLDTMQVLGASVPRLIRVGAHTGAKALDLYKQSCHVLGVKFLEPFIAIDIIIENNSVRGVVGIDLTDNSYITISCKAVILAAGGCGDIYPVTTYPEEAYGDSYAIAYRAGAKLVDMEFMQFEPCCFVYPEILTGKIVVTTMLSEGGTLLDSQHNEIDIIDSNTGRNMQKSDLALKLAEIISAGRGTIHGGVYFDATSLPRKRLVDDNALFYRPALKCGIDLTRDFAEVAPAAHTNIGGVLIDCDCKSSVSGLFAAGEAAGGIHGANRMGGCAGSETLIFGAIAGENAAKYSADITSNGKVSFELAAQYLSRPRYVPSLKSRISTLGRLKKEIGKGIGIIRNETYLEAFISMLEELMANPLSVDLDSPTHIMESVQNENIVLTAMMQARASLLRKESRGVFYRSDYPSVDDTNWKKNIVIENTNGSMNLTVCDINHMGEK